MPLTKDQENAMTRAEAKIQNVLLDLVEEAGIEVETVNVDTRNFANLRTEIIAKFSL